MRQKYTSTIKSLILFTLFALFSQNHAFSQVQFWIDNFDSTSPSTGDRDAPNHVDGDNGTGPTTSPCETGNYFFRTSAASDAPNGVSVVFSGFSGSYWRGEDIDDCFASPDIIDFTGINISGLSNFRFSGDFGTTTNTVWDTDDFIHIEYRIDGGSFVTGLRFEGSAASALAQDNNGDGTGDGTALTNSLQNFSFNFNNTGTTLDLRVRVAANDGSEEFAFDNFTLEHSVGTGQNVTMSINAIETQEDAGADLVYSFIRSGNTSGALTINFNVGGTATLNTDYTVNSTFSHTFTASNGTITFPDGTNTVTLNVDPTTDTDVEADESILVTVISGTGYDASSPNSQTGNIMDDDKQVSIIQNYPTVVREDCDQMISVIFTRTGLTTDPLTVNFDVSGSAVFGTDYTQSGATSFNTTSGSLTILSGATNGEIFLIPNPDALTEGDENIILTLSTGSYSLGNLNATTLFISDDEGGNTITQFWQDSFEDAGPSSGTRTAPNHSDQTNGGICSAGNYFVRTTNLGAVSDPDGFDGIFSNLHSSKYWRGEDVEDCQAIPDVLNWTGINISGQSNILFKGLLAVRSSTSWESGDFLIIEYQIDGGGFQTGLQFSGNGTSSDGFTTTKLMVDIDRDGTGDAYTPSFEFKEFIFHIPETGSTLDLRFRVSNGSGEEFGLDNFRLFSAANQPKIRLAQVPNNTQEDGMNNLYFNFISDCYNGTSSVNFNVGGTAIFNNDYTQTGASAFSTSSGMVTISNGSNSGTVIIDPTMDSDFEPDETVILTLTSASNHSLSTPISLTSNILNDEVFVVPSITLSPATISTNENSSAMQFTFTRTGDNSGTLVVNFSINGTTGTNSASTSDYLVGAISPTTVNFPITPTTGTITFGAGNSMAILTISPINDGVVEANETVVIKIEQP